MLEGAGEPRALFGIVAQPVQQLGPSPLGRVGAAAPVDGFQALLVGRRGDFGGFLPRPVVAPQVVVVQRLHVGVDRNHSGPGGIERNGFDGVAVDARRFDGQSRGPGQRPHVIGVALGGVIGIFLLAEQRVLGGARAQTPLYAVENGDANAESAEIDTGYDTHENLRKPLPRYRSRLTRRSYVGQAGSLRRVVNPPSGACTRPPRSLDDPRRRAPLAGPIDNRPQAASLPHIKPARRSENLIGRSTRTPRCAKNLPGSSTESV